MKKIGYLLMAAMLILSACQRTSDTPDQVKTTAESNLSELKNAQNGKSDGKNDGKNDGQTNGEINGQNNSKSEAASEEAQEAASDRPIPMDVEISSEYLSEWQDTKKIISGSAPEFYVLSDGYEELQEALDEFSAKRLKSVTEEYQTWLPAAREQYQNDNDNFAGYRAEETVTLKRADNQIFSFTDVKDSYFGADQSNYHETGMNFNPSDGKMLTLDDVVTDREAVYEYITQYLEENAGLDMPFSEYQKTLEEAFHGSGETPIQWIMDSEGLKFLFGPGSIEAPVYYRDNQGLIREKYLPGGEGLAKRISAEVPQKVDLNGDGEKEDLLLSAKELEEEYCSQITVAARGKSLEYRLPGFYSEAYLMQTEEGRAYLYVESSGDNDYKLLEVFDLNQETPVHVGTAEAAIQGHLIFDPGNFSLYTRLDALGSYTGYRRYQVGWDGMPLTDETIYQIVNPRTDLERVLVAAKTIPAWIHQEREVGSEEALKMERQEFPAGTKFWPRKTDGKTFVEMELEDGRLCDIRYELRDFVRYIEGEKEWDLFENLPYAG